MRELPSNPLEPASSLPLPPRQTRRAFLKHSAHAAAGVALTRAITSRAYAAENNTLKLALIGCGGRGGGAVAQALSTAGPTQLWALADFFPDRAAAVLGHLKPRFEKQLAVPPERLFAGLDGYRRAIDSLDPGSVVLLATPPAFRPLHFEYAVAKGMHVFMEKSFAVDAPGIRRVLRTGELARQKNLKVAGGLMSRHFPPLEAAMEQIHAGRIGEMITGYAYRLHGPVDFIPRPPGRTELAHQIANYSNFTWLNGSFIVDWLIHNIDVCCWAKNAWPISVQGMGGRQTRQAADQLYDHYAAEYTFPDGTRFHAQGRHMPRCWGFFGAVIHGTTGCAVLGEGQPKPMLFKGHRPLAEQVLWRHRGEAGDQYQIEHDRFFDAIRHNKPYNETERCAYACLTAIMGRMACESGQLITWENALKSDFELAPGLDNYTMDSAPPVGPDAHGKYPIAMPGETRVL
ncbi:MAG: Gfo/Idh/MocA family oxidoreductase [Verrucomicrobia bacterium]|nr:Gfo/Idh/MocA family oxidoreductase [Verrucomicrobiota bacterium]